MRNIEVESNCAYIITDRLMRKYFSEFDVDEGILVLSKDVKYFIDPRYYNAVCDKIEKLGMFAICYKTKKDIVDNLKQSGIKDLFLDFDRTTVSEYNFYLQNGFCVKDGALCIKQKRAIKEPSEIECIKKACAIAENAFIKTLKHIKKGCSEKEIEKVILDYILKSGATGASFDVIVAFGDNSAIPHHKTCNRRLEENMPVLIDMGAVFNGYMSDLTRTCYFGTPSEDFLKAYDAVLYANELAENSITPKIKTSDADKIARDCLSQAGYGEYFTHSLGHGVGTEIHEYPFLSPSGEGTIENGMVFTIEPGVYFNNKFGIRIEDTVLMKDGKIERLFTDEKKLIIL